jgi:hypothetical protein
MAAPQGPQPGPQGLVPSQQERQIQKLRHACGCTSGMVVMLLCLAGYLTYDLHAPSHGGLVRRLLVGLGIALAGAVVGKLAGLLWAHARLVKLLRLQAQTHAGADETTKLS